MMKFVDLESPKKLKKVYEPNLNKIKIICPSCNNIPLVKIITENIPLVSINCKNCKYEKKLEIKYAIMAFHKANKREIVSYYCNYNEEHYKEKTNASKYCNDCKKLLCNLCAYEHRFTSQEHNVDELIDYRLKTETTNIIKEPTDYKFYCLECNKHFIDESKIDKEKHKTHKLINLVEYSKAIDFWKIKIEIQNDFSYLIDNLFYITEKYSKKTIGRNFKELEKIYKIIKYKYYYILTFMKIIYENYEPSYLNYFQLKNVSQNCIFNFSYFSTEKSAIKLINYFKEKQKPLLSFIDKTSLEDIYNINNVDYGLTHKFEPYKGEGKKSIEIEKNKEKYVGHAINKKADGHGINYLYNFTEKYFGEFKNGKCNGFLSIYLNDGDYYRGYLSNNYFNGPGIYSMSNGDVFEGNFLNECKEGFGIYKWANGTYFFGEWSKGKMNGTGFDYFFTHDKYIGEFKNSLKEGFGIYYFTDGSKYVGEYKNNKRNGFGTDYFKSGNYYSGNWVDNAESGKGTFYYTNGNKYYGQWKNNVIEGKGIYYFVNIKDLYIGEFKNDKREGKGIYYWPNGVKYVGDWVDGKMHGKGKKYYANGDWYEGDFKDYLRDGNGVYFYKKTNTKKIGVYEKDKMISEHDYYG